jgi:hypothetical protein
LTKIISAPDYFNLVPPLIIQFHLILAGFVSNLNPSPGYIFDCQNVLALLHYTAPLIPPKDGYLLMVNCQWCHFLSIILHWKGHMILIWISKLSLMAQDFLAFHS